MKHELSKERLEQIANFHRAMTLPPSHDEIEAMARALLTTYKQEPVAYRDRKEMNGIRFALNFDYGKMPDGAELFAHPTPSIPAAVPDYFAGLVASARVRADKAMSKYPQPNYVLNKVAEESGEVIKAVIHYTEGREEWANVEGELIDNLAMLIRLVTEGDQVIGFTPPDTCRGVMLQAGVVVKGDAPPVHPSMLKSETVNHQAAVPEEKKYPKCKPISDYQLGLEIGRVDGWNAYRAAMIKKE